MRSRSMLEHGGNLRAALRQYGGALQDWLDLSSGINPQPYPAPMLAPQVWHRLPEDEPALALAAACYYQAPLMLPVAGSQAAIQALPGLRAAGHGPARVVVAAASYAEHAQQWSRHGHTVRQLPSAALEAAVGERDGCDGCDGCDVLVLCNPNNPNGATFDPQRLLGWAAALAARGGWLVVDEAFADSTPELSVAPWSDRPGLIVLRSVGKFFGLAGLRLGFVAAQPALLAALADALGPWAINTAAQQIGQAALCDLAWQQATRIRLAQEAQRLRQLLAASGIAASGSALFQWWAEPQAEAFCLHMAQQQIWVRLFTDARRGIRLGLPPDEAGWQRLAEALHGWPHRS